MTDPVEGMFPDAIAALAAIKCRCHMSDGKTCWSCKVKNFSTLDMAAQKMVVDYARLRAENATLREAVQKAFDWTVEQITYQEDYGEYPLDPSLVELSNQLRAALAEEGG